MAPSEAKISYEGAALRTFTVMQLSDTPAIASNSVLDLDSRRDLLDWFAKNAASLGQLYEASLRMLADTTLPGRGYLICHAIREIGNRLPSIVATLPNEGTLNYAERVQELVASFEAAGLREDGGNALAGKPLTPDLEPSLSPLLNGVAQLIADHRSVFRKRREKAIALFEAIGGEISEAVIRQWLDVTSFFNTRAHHPNSTTHQFDFNALQQHFGLLRLP
jgi:hypothetical protein